MHKPEKYQWRDWSGSDCPFTDHQASALVQFRSGIVQEVRASNCRWFHAERATSEWGLKVNHFVPAHDIIRYVPLGATLDWEVAEGAIIKGKEIVDALLRDGTLMSNMFAMSLRWTNEGGPGDVVAFRRSVAWFGEAEAPQAAAPAEIVKSWEAPASEKKMPTVHAGFPDKIVDLFETRHTELGGIVLQFWPKGLVLQVGGEEAWNSWEADGRKNEIDRLRALVAEQKSEIESLKGNLNDCLIKLRRSDELLKNCREDREKRAEIITDLNEQLRLKHNEAASLTGNLNEVLKAHNERARERDTARELLETAESTIRAQAVQIGACKSQASAMIENEKGHVHSVKSARMVIKRLVDEKNMDRAGRPSVEAWRAASQLIQDWG